MAWLAWLAGAVALGAIGVALFRRGKVRIVRWYVIASAVLFVIYFMNFALVLGAQYLPWPKYLLLAFLPATLVLIVMAIKRDRDEVMGKPGDREAAVTAAIVYGAAGYAEAGGDVGGGMDSQ